MGATLFGAAAITPPAPSGKRRTENLALIFQEILTVVVRVRANRQPVNNGQEFRVAMRGQLAKCEKEAIGKAYMPDDVRLATFAVVAFLDESVLNSSNVAFTDWARMPLQEELYGHQLAGETFFQNLESLLRRNDSQDLADLLEVYLLCLQLGYRGRYDMSGQESLRPLTDSVIEKMSRIRGRRMGFSPAWAVPEGGVVTSPPDRWIRRLAWTAGIALTLAIVCFLFFWIVLSLGASQLHSIPA
jgi:type VI secretion system protein ImpK